MDNNLIKEIHEMAQTALGKQITIECTKFAIEEGFFDNFIALYNAGYRKSVTCKDCIHRLTTNCALYYATYSDENSTKAYFNGACYNDDFYCAYGENKPE